MAATRSLGYDGVTYGVEAAFGDTPFDPSPTWTDISAWVRASGITVRRGRSSEFSDVQPGTMSLTLDNRARRFDPDYTAGPYFGQLIPQVRIRLRVIFNSVTYPIFDGYVTGWPQSYDIGNTEAVVHLEAYDLFARLATRRLPPTLLALEVLTDSPVAYFPMSETVFPTASDLSGNGWTARYGDNVEAVTSPLPGEPSFNAKAVIVEDTADPNYGGSSPFNANGPDIDLAHTVELWFHLTSSAASNAQILATNVGSTNARISFTVAHAAPSGDTELTFYFGVQDGATTTVVNRYFPIAIGTTYHVVGVLNTAGTLYTMYMNGAVVGTEDVSAGDFTGGTFWTTGISMSSSGVCNITFGHLAVYDTELSADRVVADWHAGDSGGRMDTVRERLDTIATFSGLDAAGLYDSTNIIDNTYLTAADLSGSVLAAMQAAMTTDQGRLFVNSAGVLAPQGRTADMADLTVNRVSNATLSDSGAYAYSDIPIDSNKIDLIRNAIYVGIAGATIPVIDDTSIALFDEQEESISTELDQPHDARNFGLSRLRRFADPTSRIPFVQLRPRSSSDVRYPLVFGVELGWRLTVTRTPQALGSAISKNVTVEGITHTITGVQWITDLYLAPAVTSYTEEPWFIVGDSVYGEIGVADGNKIPY